MSRDRAMSPGGSASRPAPPAARHKAMSGPSPADIVAEERQHEEAWYRRALAERFFEREGFCRLVAWNLAHLRRTIPFTRTMRVVSIGCGLGDYELALAPHVEAILAFDLSATAIEEARRRAAARGAVNVEFRAAAVQEVDLPPASWDVVYALGVLHHVPSPEDRLAILRRAHGWLRPGGWLYTRDPSARGLPRRLAYRFFRARAGVHSPHENHLDPHALAALVARAGFVDVRLDYTDVLGGPLPWLIAGSSPAFWALVAAFDRAWLATPLLRRAASQFAVVARR